MTSSVKGMRDLMGDELRWFRRIEEAMHRIFGAHGYREIRTPILEYTDVFRRGVGDSSDIVSKEMYDFTDKGGRSVTMRPENTAGVVRAMVEHKLLLNNDPQLLYYTGPMFRYERMQAGRYRQFWQIGAESFGVASPESEVESLVMLFEFLGALGLKSLSLSLNSVGTPASRPAFNAAFRTFFDARADRFCTDCHRRIETNPMRVLDCKVPSCQAALEGHPTMVEFLDEASKAHHVRLKELLGAVDIPFTENPRLVRGLDYYTRTAFEVLSKDLGAQSALLGGGRYDGLVKQLGGPDTSAFGWAIGLDRLANVLQQLQGDAAFEPMALLIPLGEAASVKALQLARGWWGMGLRIQLETRGCPLKKALQTANRTGVKLALILGDGELEKGVIAAKHLETGTQEEWALGDVPNRLSEN